MIGFLIGAGVGLVAGAGLGAIVMGLLANARVKEAKERAERYLGELDALTESTRPASDTPDLSDVLSGRIRSGNWAEQGMRAAAEMTEMEAEAFRRQWIAKRDGQPVILPSTGETWRPGFDANPTVLLGPGETYEQWYTAYAERLDSWCPGWWDELPKTVAPELARLAEERRAETYAENELAEDRIPTREGFDARPWRPNRPGIAQYPKESK